MPGELDPSNLPILVHDFFLLSVDEKFPLFLQSRLQESRRKRDSDTVRALKFKYNKINRKQHMVF